MRNLRICVSETQELRNTRALHRSVKIIRK